MSSKNSMKFKKNSELKDISPHDLALISHYIHNDDVLPVKSAVKAQELIEKYICKSEMMEGLVVCEPNSYYGLFPEFFSVPFPTSLCSKFTFIDLFAGIGGFRLAMQNLGGRCIFSSEFEPNAQKTYFENFGDMPFGDITLQSVKDSIPKKFDVLCAGFPCQAFSIAGYRKGFEDTRGTLFFDVASIIKKHRPKAFFLENVKNLKSHDGGRTYSVIEDTLKELGYVVYNKVLNTMDYVNIPQNRERIFIIGFDPQQVSKFDQFTYPHKSKLTNSIKNFIDDTNKDKKLFYTESCSFYDELKKSITRDDTIYQWRRHYVRENKSNVCPTLTANMGMGGHNVPLIKVSSGIRKLSPKECLNFQGFPNEYRFPSIAPSHCYKQAGNSVTMPLIQLVAQNIINLL